MPVARHRPTRARTAGTHLCILRRTSINQGDMGKLCAWRCVGFGCRRRPGDRCTRLHLTAPRVHHEMHMPCGVVICGWRRPPLARASVWRRQRMDVNSAASTALFHAEERICSSAWACDHVPHLVGSPPPRARLPMPASRAMPACPCPPPVPCPPAHAHAHVGRVGEGEEAASGRVWSSATR